MNLLKNEIVRKLASGDMWGQLNQMQEECGELITAINHVRRKNSVANVEKLYEEFADVFILTMQMFLIFEHKKIEAKIEEKLARSSQRMQEGKL